MQPKPNTNPSEDRFWVKFAAGTGLLLIAGGLLYLSFRKKHGDQELVKLLRRKIDLAFEQA